MSSTNRKDSDIGKNTLSETSIPSKGLLLRAQRVFVIIGVLYFLAVLLLCIPYIQTQVLFSHFVRLPLFAKFDQPEKYGLAPGKTLNLKITTADNVTLGAWFVLADPFYQALSPPPSTASLISSHIQLALKAHPTILYFHGNAATRAFRLRIHQYSMFSSRLKANVLVVDYRGFGDSEGVPTQKGLETDARAVWDWVIEHGARAEDVLVVGHSLGSSVAAHLAASLANEGVRHRGTVLLAPFSSLNTLLETYAIFGIFPLIKPLQIIPLAPDLISWALIHKFDTLRVVPAIRGRLLIGHSEDDWEIPSSHSEVLFNALMEPLLPSLPKLPPDPNSWTKEDWEGFTDQKKIRADARKALVRKTDDGIFGSVEYFKNDSDGNVVILVKAQTGGHDRVGLQEGVQDAIRVHFDL